MFRAALIEELAKVFDRRCSEYGEQAINGGEIYIKYDAPVRVKVIQDKSVDFSVDVTLMLAAKRVDEVAGLLSLGLSDFSARTPDSAISIQGYNGSESIYFYNDDTVIAEKLIKFDYSISYNTAKEKMEHFNLIEVQNNG